MEIIEFDYRSPCKLKVGDRVHHLTLTTKIGAIIKIDNYGNALIEIDGGSHEWWMVDGVVKI